jgi:sortase A
LGRIEIPRLGIDLVVFQGTDDATLRKGPGHMPGTATPGRDATGNCVIAGHRDSFFRGLADVRKGDVVLVRGSDGSAASYRLESRRVVSPKEISVAGATPDRRLTLVTCYPFRWIGPAPYRLVWTAAAVSSTPSPSHRSQAGR